MPAFGPTAPAPPEERLPESHSYVVGLLRRVADRPAIPEEEVERIQSAHVAHLNRLMKAGEIILFGPFEEDAELRGIILFRDGPVERVRAFVEADPAIVSRRLTVELLTWSAAAGLRLGPAPAPTPVDEPE